MRLILVFRLFSGMVSVGWWRDMCRGAAGSDVAGQCVSAGVCWR
jgi:hypothetical protein